MVGGSHTKPYRSSTTTGHKTFFFTIGIFVLGQTTQTVSYWPSGAKRAYFVTEITPLAARFGQFSSSIRIKRHTVAH